MAFKGTRRRNAREIAETIENVGGDLNAETGAEQTGYFAHVLSEDVDLAMDVLADIITDSQFDPEELAREKNVIVQEIGAVEDTPDDLVFDLLTAAAWPDQPIGRPILGTREGVAAFDRAGDRRLSRRAITAPARRWSSAPARSITIGSSNSAEARLAALGGHDGEPPNARALSRRRNAAPRSRWSRPMSSSPSRAAASAMPTTTPRMSSPP